MLLSRLMLPVALAATGLLSGVTAVRPSPHLSPSLPTSPHTSPNHGGAPAHSMLIVLVSTLQHSAGHCGEAMLVSTPLPLLLMMPRTPPGLGSSRLLSSD
uniref:Secreted protein n=1 Tax=Emiliania huxleyi TaxID=2903 RepID=A0A6V2SJV2_EMIHU